MIVIGDEHSTLDGYVTIRFFCWHKTTVYLTTKGRGGYIAALVIDDYPAGEGWAHAVRSVNTRLGVPISGSTGCTPTSNYGGCDQICLPSGNNNQKRCACATGFVLKSDGTGCEGEYFLPQLPKSFEMKAVYVVENVNMVYFYLQITVDWMEDL